MRRTVVTILASAIVAGCGGPSLQEIVVHTGEVWTANVIGVVGGSLLATEGTGAIARLAPPKRGGWNRVRDWFDPFPSAWAAPGSCAPQPHCVEPVAGTPGGDHLETPLLDCRFPLMAWPGVWNAIHRVKFPSAAACEAARQGGFGPSVRALLDGESVTRTYGQAQTGSQLETWRLGANDEAVRVFTDFPSGVDDPSGKQVVGGVKVAFAGSEERRISIQGIHLIGFRAKKGQTLFNPAGDTEWRSIHAGNRKRVRTYWDNTLHTPDADIEVSGYGAAKEIRSLKVITQHNIARAIGTTVISGDEPLRYSSAECCWPTSGTLITNFTRAKRSTGPRWGSEVVVFHEPCGQVEYITYRSENAGGAPRRRIAQLAHCY